VSASPSSVGSPGEGQLDPILRGDFEASAPHMAFREAAALQGLVCLRFGETQAADPTAPAFLEFTT
jgi:hypothetical protein